MIKVINSNNKNYLNKLNSLLEKRRSGKKIDTQIVTKILKDIKKNKTKALLKYEKKFSKNKNIKSTNKEINKAIRRLDPKVKKALDFAYNKILNFHKKQLKNLKNISYKDKFNNKLEYRVVPIEKIGIYTPSGLQTSLLMTAVLAKISKVKKIVLATPMTNGQLNPGIMYTGI